MDTRSRLRHQLTVGLIMVALIPLAGLQAVWSADEGALLYQVQSLAEGEGWSFEHPFPEADPAGTYYPIHLSSWVPDSPRGPDTLDCSSTGPTASPARCGYIVLAKHATFLWVSAGLFSIGGYGLLILLSVLGGLATALATSRLAALIEPAAEAPALWITALASPILMHSYVAWGHTVAAALIGWATYGLLADSQSSKRHDNAQPAGGLWQGATPRLALAFAALFLSCLVRTEAPIAVLAIGLALLPRRRRIGVSVIAVAVLGLVIDRLTATATGGPVEPNSPDERFGPALGFVVGRVEAFTATWLQPAYGSNPVDLLILAAAGFVLTAAVLTRRGPSAAAVTQALLGLAVLALLARFTVSSAALIPGLIVAFPLLFAGLVLIDRKMLDIEPVGELLAGFLLFCGAVLATQYRQGGGGEWGGRYFAAGLPLGIAVASAALMRASAEMEAVHRRRVGGLLVAAMAITSTLGVLGLRTIRQQTEQLSDEIAAAVDQLAADDGGAPVVVSSIPGLGRWMWADLDQARWLRVPQEDLGSTARRLQALGIDRLAFVSARPATEPDLLSPWFELADEPAEPPATSGGTPSVYVMSAGTTNTGTADTATANTGTTNTATASRSSESD